MPTFTVTDEERRDIHNGYCELYHTLHRLKSILAPDIIERLAKAEALIAAGMVGIHAQEEAHDEKLEKHYGEVAKEIGIKLSVWSMNEVEDLRAPHNWPAVEILTYGSLFAEISGPTWAHLWIAADALIGQSDRHNHIFIEGFSLSSWPKNRLELHTGS